MRHLLYSLPRLRAEGWEIKAWCLRSDAPDDEVEHVFFPSAKWLGPFEQLYFPAVVNLYGLWRWLCRKPRPAAIIHATCGTYLGANLTSVHFAHCVWARMQLRLGFANWRDIARYPFYLASAVLERLQWWSPALKTALAVSDSIADEVRARAPSRLKVVTLANSYDETRFNPGVRTLHRDSMRKSLGYAADDKVFCFVSTGHYRRKGFWLAVEALATVRTTKVGRNARLLVVGGNSPAVESLRAETQRRFSGSEEWIKFVGMQPEVEKYFAASDAFIFPSYFEAFCLAEIEAAACGLPLLLTPHHGTEMILRDGVNGRLLSFDPEQMSRQLAQFLTEGLIRFTRDTGKGLTRCGYADQLIAAYEGLASAPSCQARSLQTRRKPAS
jgi:glycosyltransferase involved in cell wall biosynthesis